MRKGIQAESQLCSKIDASKNSLVQRLPPLSFLGPPCISKDEA